MIDIILFAISYKLITYYALINKPIIFSSKTVTTTTNSNNNERSYNKRIEEILSSCQSLHKNYFPSFIFTNCHFQMIPFILHNSFQKNYCKPFNWISEKVELNDLEIIILDWANSIPDNNLDDETPILLINHGAGGTSRDFPGQTYIDKAFKNGWKVCVLNRRGHCGRLTKGNFNFFGSCDDLELVIENHIKSKRPKSKILLLGISAGSGLVASYMGKQGLKNMTSSSRGFVYAAVGICPGKYM
jgi:predicted alpha/beta-fold hydrolase